MLTVTKRTLGEFIQEEMKLRNLGVREFAHKLGVSHPVVGKFRYYGIKDRYGGKPIGVPDTDFLHRLALFTKVDIGTIIALVYPDASHIDTDAAIFAARYSALSAQERELVDRLFQTMGFKKD